MAQNKAEKARQEPSHRMKKAAKALLDNGGKSVSAAMRVAGYSEAMAKNPQKLTKTATWQQLMDEYLPEADVAKTHRELQNASAIQQYEFPRSLAPKKGPRKRRKGEDDEDDEDDAPSLSLERKGLTDDEIRAIVESVPGCRLIYIKDSEWARVAFFQAPDNRTRKDAVDMAYKLRGSYAAEKVEVSDPYSKLSNSELATKISNLRAALMKKRPK